MASSRSANQSALPVHDEQRLGQVGRRVGLAGDAIAQQLTDLRAWVMRMGSCRKDVVFE